ncbi:MAG: hypothetical protein J0H01_09090 [Rhizobiales bacterium]|nr:hypothetical protein [Hyphomicrobiales bacterium]
MRRNHQIAGLVVMAALAGAPFIAMLVAACFAWYNHSAMPNSALMKGTGAATRLAILQRIPIGSVLADAASVMHAQDFKCHPKKNSGFTERPDGGQRQISHPPTDFLYCDSGHWGFVISKRWQVIITERNGLVTEVFASVGLTGP